MDQGKLISDKHFQDNISDNTDSTDGNREITAEQRNKIIKLPQKEI